MKSISDEINSQCNDFIKVTDYFSANIDKLPPILQLKFLEANLEFFEKIKPIYAVAMAMTGNCSMDNEDKNDDD